MTPDDDDRTVFAPGGTGASVPPQGAPASSGTSLPPRTGLTGFGTPMAPRTDGNRIQVGDVLNHIFEVRRFIARGGMGEVYEGVNVNTDERVAIKVMLPSLAADPNIQDMFRKEARTLQRLSHPALVPYRVLAQEPQLGTFYIVTDYIDGTNLNDVIASIEASPAELAGLLRRLAEGLRAAHQLGAIHRDISPDNVLLEDGRLDQARIIDFGIAKDLDPGSKTVIGDGFAGKLSYVAPEQLGDFGRDIGAWTDVYSLALVILAVARRGGTDLGGSFVEAIDKRRKGPDLAVVPATLRPVLEAMLRADPKERLRSMDAVLDMLAGTPVAAAPAATPIPKAKPEKRVKAAAPEVARTDAAAPTPSPLKYYLGGGAALLIVLAGAGYVAFSGGSGPQTKTSAPPPTVSTAPQAAGGADAGAAVVAALPSIGCSWLDVTRQSAGPDGMTLAMAGVAGRPAEAQAAVERAVKGAGGELASADFTEVAPIDATECSSVDAFRAVRATGTPHLTASQRKFEMGPLTKGQYAGQIGARPVIGLDVGADVPDFAVYGLEPSGAISPLVADRRMFAALPKGGDPIADLGGGHYRITIDANHSGWSGILLLTGDGGFSDAFMKGDAAQRGADWPQRFGAMAAQHHWRAEMVWLRTVDEVPN